MLQKMWREEIASSKLKARTALCHAAKTTPWPREKNRGTTVSNVALPPSHAFQVSTWNVELEQPLHPMADLVTGVFSDDLAVGQAEFFKGPLEDSGHAGAGFAPVQIHQP